MFSAGLALFSPLSVELSELLKWSIRQSISFTCSNHLGVNSIKANFKLCITITATYYPHWGTLESENSISNNCSEHRQKLEYMVIKSSVAPTTSLSLLSSSDHAAIVTWAFDLWPFISNTIKLLPQGLWNVCFPCL